MSISPPSDILLDSLRGADPAARTASLEKLKKYGQTVITPANGEPSFKNQLTRVQTNGMPFHASSALTQMRNDALLNKPQTTPTRTALQQFEGTFIKNFIDTMQPTTTSSLYGKGTAGSVWQSFMSDAVAKKISEAGGVGIAKSLETQLVSEARAPVASVSIANTSPGSVLPSAPSVSATSEIPSQDASFFQGVKSFLSTLHGLLSTILPATSGAARRDEFSLTLR